MNWRPPHRPYRAEEWIRELPFDANDSHAEAARVIIEAMDLDLDEEALVVLLRQTRHAHRMALSDWKRRNDPEYQVPRARPRGRRLYDYGDDAGAGLDDVDYGDWRRVKGKWQWVWLGRGWAGWWKLNWGRPRSNPGCFRGTDIAKPPLVAIYHLCNRWCRRTTGEAFRPDFRAMDSKVPDIKNMPLLNDAARLFLLVAQDCDRRYNCKLCALVHDANYRHLDTSIP